ncbi:MAG: DUF3800 domain-containing protein [Cyanobacteriota bacterium]
MEQRTNEEEFTLFLDESGSPKPNPKDPFNDLRTQGLPFNPTTSGKYSPLHHTELANLLRGIEGKSKNNPLIQLADLCLYPLARSQGDPQNRAFLALKNANLIVDCLLEPTQINTLGIKYYCFDNS